MKKKVLKILLYILIFVLAGYLCYLAFGPAIPALWSVLKSGDENEIETFLASNGTFKGLLYLALLQFIQVLSVLLPGAPIEVAGGMLYGFFKSYITCHLSYVLANVVIFVFARRVRTDFVNSQKVQKVVDWLSKRDPFVAIILACMIPVAPNGLIPYAASLTKVNLWQFALSVYIGSIAQMLMMCYIGRKILSHDFVTMVIVVVVDFLAMFLIYKFQDKINVAFKKLTQKGN